MDPEQPADDAEEDRLSATHSSKALTVFIYILPMTMGKGLLTSEKRTDDSSERRHVSVRVSTPKHFKPHSYKSNKRIIPSSRPRGEGG